MLCDCFVFPKCLVNQFKNSVDDLTRIRVIANEYLLYKYLIFRGALIYGICTTVHEHTQLHEQWTTSLLKCTNYNQMFRQLNLCDMLDITLCSVESFLGHHPCNKSSSTHAVAGWCPPNFQHVCAWHPVNSYKKTFATWRLNPRNTNTLICCMMSRNSHVKNTMQRSAYCKDSAIYMLACVHKVHNIGTANDWKQQIMLRHGFKACFEKFADISPD